MSYGYPSAEQIAEYDAQQAAYERQPLVRVRHFVQNYGMPIVFIAPVTFYLVKWLLGY
jgi:hypothetical protein